MATVGLKGIWGLEQLDKTEVATWKLGLILIAGSGLLSLFLIKVLGSVQPDSVLATVYTPTVISSLLAFVLLFCGCVCIALITQTRSVETDLKLLSVADPEIITTIDKLRPTVRVYLPIILLSLTLGLLMVPTLVAGLLHIAIGDSYFALTSSGLVVGVYAFVLMPVLFLLSGLAISTAISQIYCLTDVARLIRIDLLRPDRYAAIANSPIRIAITLLVFTSILPIMLLVIEDQSFRTLMEPAILWVLPLGIPLVLAHVYPVMILKNRIMDLKQKELDKVLRSLQGDGDAASKISLHGLDSPTTAADLLTHQMFIESRWEWPIASHVQKLILFGLLPPLTWMLAAMIENAMY
jgi:hypothetical protein